MTRVFVLGHRGMLGHVVAAYLGQAGYEVVTSDLRYQGLPQDPLLQTVRYSRCSWVINALGAIPQKGDDAEKMFCSNTQFPLHLLQEMESGQCLIHASSDCVFSGMRGQYRTRDHRDAGNAYGLSKALGETVALDARTICFRVSIVGPERDGGSGLLGWFLKQEGTVSGFTNHMWNGITTLEWAKAANEVMRGEAPFDGGIVQLGAAEAVSKYELLRLFARVWDRDVEVLPKETEVGIDRTLVPDWRRSSLQKQLVELREWSRGVTTNQGN